MGLISKNSIINSIISYAGLAIGAFNIIFLFGQYLNSNEIGTIFLLIAFSKTFAGIAGLGFNQGIIKFNPYFKNNPFYFFKILTILAISLALICVTLWATDLESLIFSGNLNSLKNHNLPIYIASTSLVIYNLIEAYAISNIEIIKVSITREIVPRITLTILVLLYSINLISFDLFLIVFSFSNVISIIILIPTLKKIIRNDDIIRNNSKLLNLYYRYSSFIYLATLVAVLAENSDLLIIGQKISIDNAGLFQVSSYLATLIIIPYRTLSLTTSPIISNAWKNKDFNLLNDIYKKSSEVQWFLGLIIFSFIVINFNVFTYFYPANSKEIFNIFIVLGAVKLIDMGFGQNSEIIINSNSWKINFLIQILVLILFIISNLLLVSRFGSIGSAYASIISFLSLNLFRFFYLKRKYNLSPFSAVTIKIPIILLSNFLFLLDLKNDIITLLFRNLIFILIILILVFVLNISPEIKKHFKKITEWIGFSSH